MPSPFPGMDPFIEGQIWEDFHQDFVIALRESLTALVRPRYIVRAERRVYLERDASGERPFLRPDMHVARGGQEASTQPPAAAAEPRSPVVLTLPMPETRREPFLTVRERDSLEVVTVIEVLSPANKRSGSDGRREYLKKRASFLQSSSHLLELDLLRGGERLPTVESLPRGDHYAFVSRAGERPRVAVYAWTLRERLPAIPVPLADGDPDVAADLQSVFDRTYERAGYDYALDYRRPVTPPLTESEAEWVGTVLGRSDSGS